MNASTKDRIRRDEMSIQDHTFAAACYNDNTIAELEKALADGPDATDMATWGLSESEWREQVRQALAELRTDRSDP